jgi:hypothetical protein
LGFPAPDVYLQTADGWQPWEALKLPPLKFDYGDVGVADFDGDGHLDIALTCHFGRSFVLFGNGQGSFTRHVVLPQLSRSFSSRALALADFNGDGRTDIVLLSELDIEMGTTQSITNALVQVALNLPTGWEMVSVSGATPNIMGDKVAVGDLDGDGTPDILVSSHKSVYPYWFFINDGTGRSFTKVMSPELPYLAYSHGVAVANLDGEGADEAVIGFMQSPRAHGRANPMNALGIFRLQEGEGESRPVARTLISVDRQEFNRYTFATVADVDGDGRPDLIVGRQAGGLQIFFQDAQGEFIEERGNELDFGDAYLHDAQVLTLGDGRRALVVMSADGSERKGSIRAFIIKPRQP